MRRSLCIEAAATHVLSLHICPDASNIASYVGDGSNNLRVDSVMGLIHSKIESMIVRPNNPCVSPSSSMLNGQLVVDKSLPTFLVGTWARIDRRLVSTVRPVLTLFCGPRTASTVQYHAKQRQRSHCWVMILKCWSYSYHITFSICDLRLHWQSLNFIQ